MQRRAQLECLAFIAVFLIASAAPLLLIDGSDASGSTVNDGGISIYYERNGTNTVKTVPGTPYKGQTKPLVIPSVVKIEGKDYTVTVIGASSFVGWNINSITIPDSVYKIEKDAFRNCSKVTEIHLNGKLTGEKHEGDDEKDIGENAFSLGYDKNPVKCDVYGFTPTRNVWEVENPYEDIFGKNTTVHFKDLTVDSKDSLIHIALISIGVVALLFMGRSVKVKKIKRRKVKSR